MLFDYSGRIQNGSEIAREYGISRQAVSSILKNAFKKMYNRILIDKLADTPYEASVVLMHILGVNRWTEEEVREFYGLFPKDIQKEIRTSAKMY